MIFPRQIIYNKKISKIIFSTIFDIKIKKNKIISEIKKRLNIDNKVNFLFSSRGRTACYHIISYLVKKKKNNNHIIMSPYTIFDLVNTVKAAGGNPIFVDSPNNSFGICKKKLLKIIKNKKINSIIYTFYSANNKNFIEIKKIAQKKKIDLILDLAISPCLKFKNKSIVNYSKYSFMSFSLFKFISVIQGGAVLTKDKNLNKYIHEKEKNWGKYQFLNLLEYYFKGLKFIFATNKFLFNLFIFKIFSYSDINKIKFISKHAKNDPDPIQNYNYSTKYKKKLTNYQMRSINDQIKTIETNKSIRKKNYNFLINQIKNNKLTLFKNYTKFDSSFINFPILCKNKELLSKFLYKNKIDHSKYFYRDCSNLSIFKNFKYGKCTNIKTISKNIVTLPIYHKIGEDYLIKVSKVLNNF